MDEGFSPMAGSRRLPTRLQRSQPRGCVETISQGYPQTAGFSSEISSRLQSFRHRWKCLVKGIFPLWEKNALDAGLRNSRSPESLASRLHGRQANHIGKIDADFLIHRMYSSEHEEFLRQGLCAPGAFGCHRRGE
jgi:hypothetical protein